MFLAKTIRCTPVSYLNAIVNHYLINPTYDQVCKAVHDAGFFAEVDVSGSTMQKKVREGQLAQFNFILVVGEKEAAEGTVNVRLRNNTVAGTKTIAEVLAMFQDQSDNFTPPEGEDEASEKLAAAEKAAAADGKNKGVGGGGKAGNEANNKDKKGPPKEGSKEAKALANKPSPEEIERRKKEAVAAKAEKEKLKAEKAAAAAAAGN